MAAGNAAAAVQATATLSDLKIELFDLAPSDGIAAAILFDGWSESAVRSLSGATFGQDRVGPGPSPFATMVSRSSALGSASASTTAGDLFGMGTPSTATAALALVGLKASQARASAQSLIGRIVLTPQTRLVVTANASPFAAITRVQHESSSAFAGLLLAGGEDAASGYGIQQDYRSAYVNSALSFSSGSGVVQLDWSNESNTSFSGFLHSDAFVEGQVFADVPPAGSAADNPLMPVDQRPLATGGTQFAFVIAGVTPFVPVFIDPLVAYGYEFAIESGPSFASVLLPNAGDGLYQMQLWNAGAWVNFNSVLEAGVTFDFLANVSVDGVTKFRIVGIETDAMLDPADPNAFVTGLTFNGSGEVKLTQTSLSVSVPIPEPSTYAMFIAGLLVFASLTRKRNTAT